MGGHRPPKPPPPPMSINPLGPDRYDSERVLLDVAKNAYVADRITLDHFEQWVADILTANRSLA